MPLRRILAATTLASGLLALPAAASTCTDSGSGVELEDRVAACEQELGSVYDRSAYTHLLFNLGRSLRLLGRNEEALAPLNEVLSYQPDNPLYWAELARLYLALNEPGTAAAMFGQALAQEPGNPWLLGDRAEAWANLGRPADCLADLETALPLMGDDPDVPWYINLQGRCHAGEGDQDAAFAAYDRAAAMRPDYADAQGNRITALAALGRYDRVLSESAALIDPAAGLSDGWALSLYGLRLDALIYSGQSAAIDGELAALQARFPQGGLPVANLAAWALLMAGRTEEADKAAAPLREMYYDAAMQGYMLDTLGQIDLALDRRDQAIQALHDAVWLQPGLASAWIPALIEQGLLPTTRTADDILLTVTRCIEDKGPACDLKPRPAGGPSAEVLVEAARPDQPAPEGLGTAPGDAPAFEPAPGAPGAVPVSPAPAPAPAAEPEPEKPRLGAAPKPVKPTP